MARAKRSVHSKKRRRAVLQAAEGYSGARSRHLRKANEQLMHSGNYACLASPGAQGRVPPSGSCASTPHAASTTSRTRGSSRLKCAEIDVDRKILADLAVRDQAVLGALVATAREALEAA